MTASQFDKIESTYRDLQNNDIAICKDNDVEYYDYLGWFVSYGLFNYRKKKALIGVIDRLDFNDELKCRAVLSKSHLMPKEFELQEAEFEFKKSKGELFEWLDKTKEPYLFILNPVFNFGSGISYKSWIEKRVGYKRVNHTGTDNLDIACDYARYRLTKLHPNN